MLTQHGKDMVHQAINELIPNTLAQANDPHLKLRRIERSEDYFNYAVSIAPTDPELSMELLTVLDRSGFLADKPFTGEQKLVDAFRKNPNFTYLAMKHRKLIWWK